MSDNRENPEVEGIITQNSPSKMEVKVNEVKSEGDYNKTPVYIYHDWCKKCGLCVAFCPKDVLGRNLDGSPFVKAPENCIHCETCDRMCPDFAITGARR